MKKIIVGLDLNSDHISATAARVNRFGGIYILGSERLGSDAIVDGNIKDIDKATDDVRRLLKNLEKKIARRARYVYANINDRTVRGEVSRGMIGLAPRGRVINGSDIRRCLSVGSMFDIPLDRELVHSFPQRFFVDEKNEVRDPLGLYGTKLSVDMYMITAGVSSLQNIHQCVDKAGFILEDIVFSGLAASFSVLQKQEKEEGAMLVDIGSENTSILWFNRGILEKISVLETGCSKEAGNLAEDIKDEALRFLPEENPKNVVFTGAGPLSEDLLEKAEAALNKPARIGIARNISGNFNNTEAVVQASSIGIIEYVVANLRSKIRSGSWLHNAFRKTWDTIDSYF